MKTKTLMQTARESKRVGVGGNKDPVAKAVARAEAAASSFFRHRPNLIHGQPDVSIARQARVREKQRMNVRPEAVRAFAVFNATSSASHQNS